VVDDWDELSLVDATGKIVVMNCEFTSYGAGSSYRRLLAGRAAEKGAVAALVRSIAPFSLSSLHTGTSTTASIPAAAITSEVSLMLKRMQTRGQRIVLSLTMGATGCTPAGGCEMVKSSNVIAELKGTELPGEVIVIGGHIDSWDVGQGAVDDGGGAFAAWGALNLLKTLGIAPKRTIRAVFWNAEENGGQGARGYFDNHKDEKHVMVVESDGGVWTPFGFTFSSGSLTDTELAGLRVIGEQLARIGAGNVTYGGAGADTQVWCQQCPCGSQVVLDPFTNEVPSGTPETSGYFWYHHTDADMVSAFTPQELDRNVGSFAVMAWGVAEYGLTPPGGRGNQGRSPAAPAYYQPNYLPNVAAAAHASTL